MFVCAAKSKNCETETIKQKQYMKNNFLNMLLKKGRFEFMFTALLNLNSANTSA